MSNQTDDPSPAELLAANKHLDADDMRDLLVGSGMSRRAATEVTQPRRDDEQRSFAAQLGAALSPKQR